MQSPPFPVTSSLLGPYILLNTMFCSQTPSASFPPTRSVLLRIRNVSDHNCRQNQNTFYVRQPFFENGVVCEITWKNTVERSMPQMTIWRMRVACWMTNSYNIHVSVKHNKYITQIYAQGNVFRL